ncbi:MAG: glycosyltransferase family 2 protein [Herpetosiphonaceae bacterium]|nr:glycosyltransferase family 2 protein [Herpetosiphonaceae bacterium]
MYDLHVADDVHVASLHQWPFTVTIAMPAYNEAQGIASVIEHIQAVCPQAEILVINDASTDDTAAVATAAGARVISQPYNKGNGAAVKTAIRNATGEVIMIIDADGQHDPADIPRLLEHMTEYDMVVGERHRDSHASAFRMFGNWLLARFASYVVSRPLADLTCGFRAMRADVIREFVHLLPNGYSWPTTSLMSFAKAGYSVKFVPIAALRRTGGRSRQKLLQNGVKFVMIILKIVMLFSPLRIVFPVGLLLWGLSIASYLWGAVASGRWLHIPASTVMFFVGAIVVWMFGLLAEQIVALGLGGRRER